MQDEILDGVDEIKSFLKIKSDKTYYKRVDKGLPTIKHGNKVQSTKFLILEWLTKKKIL